MNSQIILNWFRPPFHINPLLNRQMLSFAGLCDRFFSICRTLEITHGTDYINKAALVCHDNDGWYFFGFPQRFPLTSGEIQICDIMLKEKLYKIFGEDLKNLTSLKKLSGKIIFQEKHPIYGDAAAVIYLDTITASKEDNPTEGDHIIFVPLHVVAIFPSEKKNKKHVNKIETILKQMEAKSSEVSSIRMTPTRINLLAKIADEILSQSSEEPFNWQRALQNIADKVSLLLSVKICSIFLRESSLNYPYHATYDENINAFAFTGYDDKKIIEFKLKHKMADPLDASNPAGITVSILCDRLASKSQGKVVILNHRLEIGGYSDKSRKINGDMINERVDRDKDFQTILVNEATLRGWQSNDQEGQSPAKFLEQICGEEYLRIKKKFDYKDFTKFGQSITKTDHDDHWKGLFDVGLSQNPCRALLGVPIILDDKPIGCIKVEAPDKNKRSGLYETDRFTFQDLILLDCIAKLIAIAIQITHDKENLAYDALTTSTGCKIYTHPAIKRIFSPENKKFANPPAKYHVIFIDIDNFKSINSDLGYSNANKVIIEIGRTLYRSVKQNGNNKNAFLARFGGDEFYIIFPLDKNGFQLDENGFSVNTNGDRVDEHGKPLEQNGNVTPTYRPENDMDKTQNEEEKRSYRILDNLRERDQELQQLVRSLPSQNERHHKRIVTLSLGSAIDSDLDEAIDKASTGNRIAKWAGKSHIVYFEKIQNLMPPQRKAPIKIHEVLPPKHAIIDVGREHGVIDGLMFQVKHPPMGLDTNFELVKAYVRVEVAFPRSSIVKIEQSTCDISVGDEVFVRT